MSDLNTDTNTNTSTEPAIRIPEEVHQAFVSWVKETGGTFTVGLIKSHLVKATYAVDPRLINNIFTNIDERLVGRANVVRAKTASVFTPDVIAEFYRDHVGKPYYEQIVKSVEDVQVYAFTDTIASTVPFIIMAPKETQSVVEQWRSIMGATDSRKANPGTLRAIYGGHNYDPDALLAMNGFHGSDSQESAERELLVVLKALYAADSRTYEGFCRNLGDTGWFWDHPSKEHPKGHLVLSSELLNERLYLRAIRLKLEKELTAQAIPIDVMWVSHASDGKIYLQTYNTDKLIARAQRVIDSTLDSAEKTKVVLECDAPLFSSKMQDVFGPDEENTMIRVRIYAAQPERYSQDFERAVLNIYNTLLAQGCTDVRPNTIVEIACRVMNDELVNLLPVQEQRWFIKRYVHRRGESIINPNPVLKTWQPDHDFADDLD